MSANFEHTIGRLLVVTGMATLVCAGFVLARASYDRTTRATTLVQDIVTMKRVDRGRTLGLLEVPRLGLSTIVVEGDDPYSLLVGAGHLPETPLPWLDGNSVIAGHRDTDFRPLRRIREGDMIRFRAADTAIDYVVRETTIVAPTDVTVLRPTSRSVLTLITCYPFTYIGPAPKRFIVRAVRVSNASDNATTHNR
jgi:sortase A